MNQAPHHLPPPEHPLKERIARALGALSAHLRAFWAKAQTATTNNLELGRYHYEKGNLKDAVFRFRLVTWLDVRHQEGWLMLARSYQALGDMMRARWAAKKLLQIAPDHVEGKALLDSLKQPKPAA